MSKKKPKKEKKTKGDWFFVASACGHEINSQGNCSGPGCWNHFNRKYK